MNIFRETSELRKNSRQRLGRLHPYVFKRKWYSYRRFKVNLCIWASSFLVYFFVKLKVRANCVTLLYILSGICGGVLLCFRSHTLIYTALLIFYFRMVLDWSDGWVARINNEASISGQIFDSYSALFGWVPLWVGLSFYLAHYTSAIFYYLAPIIPALFTVDLYANARETIIYHQILQRDNDIKADDAGQRGEITGESKIRRLKRVIDMLFAHNTSTVDFMLLLVFVELLTNLKIVWVYYLGFLSWQVIIFIARLALLIRGGWAEKETRKLRKIIYG